MGASALPVLPSAPIGWCRVDSRQDQSETFRLPRIAILMAWVIASGCAAKPPKPVNPAPNPGVSTLPAETFRFKDYNLVFISFDALQAAHVGAYGNPRNVTPNFDKVASQGYCFTQVNSVASWTVPSSMSWFTGVYPSEHRMTNKYALYTPTIKKPANLQELSPELVTLAELLKRDGYVTGGFTGNAGVSGGFGYEQGFDVYFYEPGKFGGFDQSIPKAIEWLKTNRDKKFFLFLHGYDCHGQNTPKEGFDYRFVAPGYDRRYTGSEIEQEALREAGLDQGQLTLSDADVQFWRAIYDEKINRTDARFQEFLEEFDKLGLHDKTLFILTSDHGTEFFEHRRIDHGFTLYDEQIHVPLVIRLPKHPGGVRLTSRISSIDLMPTILDLLEIDPGRMPQTLRGTSLVPVMRGEASHRNCFSETDYREYTFKRSIVRDDGWKLIFTLETNSRELYNLNTDPGETINLAAERSNLADELQQTLFAHFKSIGHDLTARDWVTGLNPVYPSQGLPGK